MYIERPDGSLRFRWVKAPSGAELTRLIQTLARRIGRYLERQGLLERGVENSYPTGDGLEAGPMEQLLGSSMTSTDARMSRTQDAQERPTYRIAVGPQKGRKVFMPHKTAGSHFGRWSEATAAPLQRGEAHGRAEQTLPACEEPVDDGAGKVAGFSLHAGVAARADIRCAAC